MTVLDWVPGDKLGLAIPAHSDALRAGGAEFLTNAFHASGALPTSNRVRTITQLKDVQGGGTGRKALLSVDYEKPSPDLHTELFVKFSRDFDDEIRDRSRQMMESEVRLALLSRTPGFPIAVPACLFADFHQDSGTGILITERVAFGQNGIERQYGKCLDHELPEPLAHYEALVKALARLAGTHKAGRLPANVAEQFPFDAKIAAADDPIRYDARRMQNRVARFGDFAAQFPQLLPRNITSRAFIAQLAEDIPLFLKHEAAIKRHLHSKTDFIALCHWNANIDNAWFWRNDDGELEAGLLDWGRVGQMNVAASLYGALSGAETKLWADHLDDLLALFADEFRRYGGPAIDIPELKSHLRLFTAMMGLAYLMDAPPIIRAEIPDLTEAESPFDSRFTANENARVQLHMMIMFLNQWQTQDFGAVLRRLLDHAEMAAQA